MKTKNYTIIDFRNSEMNADSIANWVKSYIGTQWLLVKVEKIGAMSRNSHC